MPGRTVVARSCLPLVAASLEAGTTARETSFDEGWRFHRGDAPGAGRPDFESPRRPRAMGRRGADAAVPRSAPRAPGGEARHATPEIDGALVEGASLKPDFVELVRRGARAAPARPAT